MGDTQKNAPETAWQETSLEVNDEELEALSGGMEDLMGGLEVI
ncbi:hypothetical protein [Streptomyces sp. NBC_01276]